MKFKIFSALFVAGFVALYSVPAMAVFSVTLSDNNANSQLFTTVQGDGTIKIVFSDLNAGLQADFANNNFQLTASPNASSATLANLNTTQILMNNSGALTTLHVVVTDTYNTPVGATLSVFNALTLGSSDPSSGTVSGNQTTLINGVVATPAALASLTGFGTNAASTSNLTFPPAPPPPPFDMTTDLTLTFTGADFNGNISSSSSAQGAPNAAVPEPASLLLWGGLMMAGVVGASVRRHVHRS